MPLKNKTRDIERASIVRRAPLRSAQTAKEHEHPLNPAVALQRATSLHSSTLRPADILSLQRTVGNRAVQQILSGRARQSQRLTIQAKLVVGPAGDHYEREADRVAAIVMQTSQPSVPQIQRQHSEEEDHEKLIQTKPLVSSITPLIQRQVTPEEEEKETAVQRQSDGGQISVAPGVEHGIERARGGGHSLPRNLLTRMERSFGADFGSVRVHADAESDLLNRSVHARAFTTGRDLFFKQGEYNPESLRGQELIAHELTHVLQQNGSGIRKNGLSLQRQGDDASIVASAVEKDRRYWKTLSWKEKLAALIGAPVIAPFTQMWETGKEVALSAYDTLGKKPGFLEGFGAALKISLGTLIAGAWGLVEGALRGLAFGIGNPLYSAGKRLLKGVVAAPAVVWDFLKSISGKAIVEGFQEARGIFDADPTHQKYGNLSQQELKNNFFAFGSPRRKNYNRDELTDLSNYALQLTGGTASVTKFLTGPTVGQFLPALESGGKVLSELGAVGGVVGAVTSLWDASKGFKQWKDTSRTVEQQRLGLGRGLSGITSATQQTATATSNIQHLASPAVSATAQVVSGGAALATGTIDIIRGLYARSKATENIARLEALKAAARNEDIRQAAQQAKSTQEIRQSTASQTIAKGVLASVGGGLLIAVSAGLLAASLGTPLGWGFLAGAAVVGAVSTFLKWLSKRKRKKEVAMRELNVTEDQMKEWERKKKKIEDAHWWPWNKERVAGLKALGPDPLQAKLDQYGFKSIGHFYANYINYTANKMYLAGVGGREDLEAQINADLDARTATLMATRQAAVLQASEPDVFEARLSMLDWQLVESAREAFYRSRGMDYKELKQTFGVIPAEGNLYPQIEELLGGMGLRFDFRKKPAEPNAEKIGKALHE